MAAGRLSDQCMFPQSQNSAFVDLLARHDAFLVLKQRLGDWQLTVAEAWVDKQAICRNWWVWCVQC
jgi:hypothetical protein